MIFNYVCIGIYHASKENMGRYILWIKASISLEPVSEQNWYSRLALVLTFGSPFNIFFFIPCTVYVHVYVHAYTCMLNLCWFSSHRSETGSRQTSLFYFYGDYMYIYYMHALVYKYILCHCIHMIHVTILTYVNMYNMYSCKYVVNKLNSTHIFGRPKCEHTDSLITFRIYIYTCARLCRHPSTANHILRYWNRKYSLW